MPVIGLGTWQFNVEPVENLKHAIDLGYCLIDTSSDYGTQPDVGRAVRKSDGSRERLFVETKVEENDDAYQACKEYISEEMGLEYADMVVIHRPPEEGAGIDLWEGLIKAQDSGFIYDIGVSNYTQAQIDSLIEATGVTPAVNQIEWSPFGHSKAMLEYCQEKGIIIQAYSPLTRGKRLTDAKLKKIAQKYGKSPAQILLRWNLQMGTVPIPKANDKKHQEENLNIFDFEIEIEDMQTLSDFNEHYSSLGGLPYV